MYEQIPTRITAKKNCRRRIAQVEILAAPDNIVMVVVFVGGVDVVGGGGGGGGCC
jgi:hypothetical protein